MYEKHSIVRCADQESTLAEMKQEMQCGAERKAQISLYQKFFVFFINEDENKRKEKAAVLYLPQYLHCCYKMYTILFTVYINFWLNYKLNISGLTIS